jgi:hypothetical protein
MYKPRVIGVATVVLLSILTGLIPQMTLSAVAATTSPVAAANEINGLIWRDENANGGNDASEPGFGGVTVQLLNAAGTVVGTTVTSSAGIYSFSPVTGGPYTVQVAAPTYFEVVGGGIDQDLTAGGNPVTGVSSPVMPGVSVDGALRPIWVVSLGSWGGGPLSGTTPFATDPASNCPTTYAPGDDCSNTDNVVRSGDVTSFLWAVSASNTVASLNTPLQNVTLIQTVTPAAGASIVGGSLPNVCQNVSGVEPASQVLNNPDGSITLICNLGTWTSSGTASLFQWDVKVNASPNGSTFTSTAVATSTTAPIQNLSTNPIAISNAVPSTTIEDPFVISSGFKYQLNKFGYSTTSTYQTIDGVARRGKNYNFLVGISSPQIGNEPIAQPITFTEDTFITLTGQLPNTGGDIEHYLTSCSESHSTVSYLPTGYDSGINGVQDSGTCGFARSGDNTSPYTITLSGIDTNGPFPTRYGNGTGDLSNGPYYVAVHTITIFVPDTAVDGLDGVMDNVGTGTSGIALQALIPTQPLDKVIMAVDLNLATVTQIMTLTLLVLLFQVVPQWGTVQLPIM